MINEMDLKYVGNATERVEKDGEMYLVYEWRGHRLMILEEDAEVYEYYMMVPIDMSFGIYAHIDLRKEPEEATTEELRNAILHGANDELALYGIRLKEQAVGEVAEPTFGYNEKVGIFFFREPQDLLDEETAWQHKNKWCIMKRYGGDIGAKVFCYAGAEKYNERIRTLFIKEYLGKGYDLFFHTGNGEGVYEEFPEDDKSILAEYEKDGVHYYYKPEEYNEFSFFMKHRDCYRVVTVDANDRPHKIVCYATEPQYNEKVLEAYRKYYFDKGYYLIGLK